MVSLSAVVTVALVFAGLRASADPHALLRMAKPSATAAPSAPAPATTAPAAPLPVVKPPAGLPVVDYDRAPAGFPADPDPLSTTPLLEGLRPVRTIAAYDAPGGRPRALLAPMIRGVTVTMPIVERRSGWAGVLLPSANRTVAWVPPGGWTTVALRDQIVVVRSTHQLMWFRDGEVVRSWPVSLGTRATPTPLGRTFILGRSAQPGYVYAGTKVFALGAVPDDPKAVPPGLRGAHIGIHTWYHDRELGRNTTDGCIRLTKKGQQLLLDELSSGTEVVVVDEFALA